MTCYFWFRCLLILTYFIFCFIIYLILILSTLFYYFFKKFLKTSTGQRMLTNTNFNFNPLVTVPTFMPVNLRSPFSPCHVIVDWYCSQLQRESWSFFSEIQDRDGGPFTFLKPNFAFKLNARVHHAWSGGVDVLGRYEVLTCFKGVLFRKTWRIPSFERNLSTPLLMKFHSRSIIFFLYGILSLISTILY